jgi:ankyrin repeat protein
MADPSASAWRYATIEQLQAHLAASGPPLSSYRDTGSSGRTVLHYAAFDGKLDKLNWLLDEGGVDMNIQMDNGDTPLIEALHSELENGVLQALLARGALPVIAAVMNRSQRQLDFARTRFERSPADRSSIEMYIRSVEVNGFLLGTNFAQQLAAGFVVPVPHAQYVRPATALMGAAMNGHLNIVQTLLAHGAVPVQADIDAAATDEIRALLVAAMP